MRRAAYRWSFEQFGMGAGPGKTDGSARPVCVFEAIDQKEVPADVTFPAVRPRASERVISPLGAEWRVVGDKKDHDRLQSIHVVSARTREPLPVLTEFSAVASLTRQVGPFTGGGPLQVP